MIFTIEHWLKEYKRSDAPLTPGTRFSTTENYTGGNDMLTGIVTGRLASPDYGVADFLETQGFTMHELYTVKLDNGHSTVMWPEELERV